MATRILIADRQDLFREALRRVLELQKDFSVVADTNDGMELVKLVEKHKPDVILLDLRLRNQGATEALKQLSDLKVDVRPIVLTDKIEKREIVDILLCGARGVIRKEEATALLFKSIRAVMNGEYWISREGICDLVQPAVDVAHDGAQGALPNGKSELPTADCGSDRLRVFQ
jgi:DNA-binding NarL/FixJ family response regulator